MRLVYTRKE